MKLNRLHTSLRKDFRTLPEAESLDHFESAYSGQYVGLTPVRQLGPAFMAMLRFRGWKGKRFVKNGDELSGSNRFGDGQPPSDRFPMQMQIEPSETDGRPALVATYPHESGIPWRWARDEFREIDDSRLLGITTFELPLLRHIPLAFVLVRD